MASSPERVQSGRAYVAFAVKHTALFKIMNRPELTLGKNAVAIAQASQTAFGVVFEVMKQCQAEGLSLRVAQTFGALVAKP